MNRAPKYVVLLASAIALLACEVEDGNTPPIDSFDPNETNGPTGGAADGTGTTAGGEVCESEINQWDCQMKAYPVYCDTSGGPGTWNIDTGWNCWTSNPGVTLERQNIGCVSGNPGHVGTDGVPVPDIRVCGLAENAPPDDEACLAQCIGLAVEDYGWEETIIATGFNDNLPIAGQVHCIALSDDNDPYLAGTDGTCEFPADTPSSVMTNACCDGEGCPEGADGGSSDSGGSGGSCDPGDTTGGTGGTGGGVAPDCSEYRNHGAGLGGRLAATNYAYIDYDWVWDTAEPSPDMLWDCDAGRYKFSDGAFHDLTSDSLPFVIGIRNGDHSLKAWEHDSSYVRVGDRYDLDTIDNALIAFSELWPTAEGEIHITLEVTTAASAVKTIHVDIEP